MHSCTQIWWREGVAYQLPGVRTSIIIIERNLDMVLALANRVFVQERGAVFHEGPIQPLLSDLSYRKHILWV